jgi:hypothetical protein
MAVHRRPRLILLLAAGLIFAGCRDTKIVAYRVPKDSPSAPPAEAATPAPAIRWQAPPGWQEQPADAVRQGSFRVTGADGATADMSVITFPGDAGGDLANVNRWRGQVQLPPITSAELPQALTKVNGPAGEFLVVDLLSEAAPAEGGRKTRILGAILKQPAQTWFLKLMGAAALVEAQKPAFLDFLQSVQFSSAAGSPPVASPAPVANTNDLPPDARGLPGGGALPPGHPAIGDTNLPAGTGMASTPVAVAIGQPLVWTAPPQWTPTAGSATRKGSYAITGPEGQGDLAITAFPGDVGGDLANVNRWRDQLELPPITDLAGTVEPLDATGLHMLVFDGANHGRRILGAIVSRPTETWFFKLTGPDALVARTKPAFLDFLRTVKAP